MGPMLLLSQVLLASAAAQNVGAARHLLSEHKDFGKRVISGAGATFPCVSLVTRRRSRSILHLKMRPAAAQLLADAHAHMLTLALALLRSKCADLRLRAGCLQMGRVPKVDGDAVVQEA